MNINSNYYLNRWVHQVQRGLTLRIQAREQYFYWIHDREVSLQVPDLELCEGMNFCIFLLMNVPFHLTDQSRDWVTLVPDRKQKNAHHCNVGPPA